MPSDSPKPELRVTAFSDYICPFCYIGSRRLLRLNHEFDLKVNWCFIEIHPDTPPEGMPVADLGYARTQWEQMMDNLEQTAAEESLSLKPHGFTTNSHQALLLAEAAKQAGRERFYALHERLFAAFFCDGQNIGTPSTLRSLAEEAGLPEPLIDAAWRDPRYERRLQENLVAAAKIRLHGTPTFIINNRIIAGAVPLDDLRDAAHRAPCGR